MSLPKFDWSMNFGHALTILTLIVGIVTAYDNMQADIRIEREARMRLETLVITQIAEMKAGQDRNWDKLERRMESGDSEIKGTLLRIEERLNSMLTPPQRVVPR